MNDFHVEYKNDEALDFEIVEDEKIKEKDENEQKRKENKDWLIVKDNKEF